VGRDRAARADRPVAPLQFIVGRVAPLTTEKAMGSLGRVVAALAGCLLSAAAARGGDFALRDGDTVVFLGDSITAERTYGKIVETYTLLRFPGRKVRFINAGWGGDTAAGGLARLQKDVFDRGATVLTVAYGINDIGWGGKADAEHRQKYLDSIRGIVGRCKANNVRVFVCSAAATGADPDKSEDDFLQKMCDEGMKISTSLGEGAIDVQRTMRQVQWRIKQANASVTDEKKKETLHAADGIHLNDLGQTAMAYAILKGLGAPRDVSSVTLDVRDARVEAEAGCKVTGPSYRDGKLSFDRLDEGLPLNFGLFGGLKFRFIPVPDEMNRYMLTVKGLRPGKYAVTAGGRKLGTWTAEQLAAGVNLASATADPWVPGGPWEAQAWLVNMLTDARNDAVAPEKFFDDYLKENPNRAAIARQTTDANAAIEGLQRQTARPVSYHFVITAAE
jgi:lysophospholipase L1-like esterase